jgi:hypothetical protein
MKHQQRKDAFRLARKVRLAQQQMAVMQRDREQLVTAVSYTKGQTQTMGQVLTHLHQVLSDTPVSECMHIHTRAHTRTHTHTYYLSLSPHHSSRLHPTYRIRLCESSCRL